jgi:hypothetical protein
MPAYPFKHLTLREFIDKAKSLGATQGTNSQPVIGPRGQATMPYLEIKKDGETRMVIIPSLQMDDYLLPSILRSLVGQLDLPPEDFYLILG